ncbi:unnamed protein product [Caenorhabditis angaria]|uniref:Serpentine receptor class gamma n=1 Tax=Caenorhabditis angaria TaxID=860376 RepID=A0A9P1N084_9PELO|nr:unnamed protein product [Caenorhabditis angaria]
MDLYDNIELIFMAFAIATIPIYCYISFVLLAERKKVFSSSFYKLFSLLTCFDILSCFCMISTMTIPSIFFPDEIKDTVLAKIFTGLLLFLRTGQGTATTYIAVNRATVFIFPLKYIKIWPKRFIFYILIFPCFGLPFLFGIFYADINYIVEPISGRPFPNFIDTNIRDILFMIALVMEFYSLVVIFLAYILVVVKLRKIGKQLYSNQKTEENTSTRIAIIVCCCEIIYFIFLGLCPIFAISTKTFYAFINPVTYVYSTINCFVLLLFCPPIRDLWKPIKIKNVTTITL